MPFAGYYNKCGLILVLAMINHLKYTSRAMSHLLYHADRLGLCARLVFFLSLSCESYGWSLVGHFLRPCLLLFGKNGVPLPLTCFPAGVAPPRVNFAALCSFCNSGDAVAKMSNAAGDEDSFTPRSSFCCRVANFEMRSAHS